MDGAGTCDPQLADCPVQDVELLESLGQHRGREEVGAQLRQWLQLGPVPAAAGEVLGAENGACVGRVPKTCFGAWLEVSLWKHGLMMPEVTKCVTRSR